MGSYLARERAYHNQLEGVDLYVRLQLLGVGVRPGGFRAARERAHHDQL